MGIFQDTKRTWALENTVMWQAKLLHELSMSMLILSRGLTPLFASWNYLTPGRIHMVLKRNICLPSYLPIPPWKSVLHSHRENPLLASFSCCIGASGVLYTTFRFTLDSYSPDIMEVYQMIPSCITCWIFKNLWAIPTLDCSKVVPVDNKVSPAFVWFSNRNPFFITWKRKEFSIITTGQLPKMSLTERWATTVSEYVNIKTKLMFFFCLEHNQAEHRSA